MRSWLFVGGALILAFCNHESPAPEVTIPTPPARSAAPPSTASTTTKRPKAEPTDDELMDQMLGIERDAGRPKRGSDEDLFDQMMKSP